MNAVVILFLVGIIFLAFEVFMPGAVLGILGFMAMVGGCILAFSVFGFLGGLLASAIAILLLGAALFLEFYFIPRTRLGKKMFVQSKVDSTSQPPIGNDEMLGKEGEALTTLAPSGFITVEGKRYEAFCRSGHAPKGARLQICGRDNFRLIVNQVS